MISVIIPVYRVEDYLDQCVQSVTAQTYGDLEIILVDDGSPDRCGAMCDAWAKKDSRIRVIHQKNGGAAAARNTGIKIAQGKWVSFVDSDDFLLPNMYETLLQLTHRYHCDLAEVGFSVVDRDGQLYQSDNRAQDIVCMNAEQAMREHIQDTVFRQIVWNKLYTKENMVPFVEGKQIDDEFWTYQVIGNSNRLVYTQESLYRYRQHDESIMHKQYEMWHLQVLEAKQKRLDYICQRFPNLYELAKQELFFCCLYHEQNIQRYLSGEAKKQAQRMLRQYFSSCQLDVTQWHALPTKQKVWSIGARLSLPLTARVRNMLRIGL